MKERFFGLADALTRELERDEVLLCHLAAERSDFVRFNQSRVRQAGSVEQRYLSLRLLSSKRQASARIALAGGGDDLERARATLARLREVITQLPEDPWLVIAEQPASTTTVRRGALARAEDVVQQVMSVAAGFDFVGFYAGGTIYRAFANSLGQRNWHEVDTFNFDWSMHLRGDKAVKDGYAGFEWAPELFAARLDASAARLSLLEAPARTLAPAEYRAYLAPRALEEITGLLALEAFSARARATRQSPLLRMEHGESLAPVVSIVENTEGAIAPCFQEDGFVRPRTVRLITQGRLADSLVSPRSAGEYGLDTNGANASERPESLDMAPGELEDDDALEALDTGLYIGSLWYLNFSDRPAGRMTGMTRFATFWVERGRLVAPVNALRFDDTIYRMLGEKLVALTRSRELLPSTSTYDERSTASSNVPGALLESLRFTL